MNGWWQAHAHCCSRSTPETTRSAFFRSTFPPTHRGFVLVRSDTAYLRGCGCVAVDRRAPAYSLDGLLTVLLLFICVAAYIKRFKRLREFFLSEKNGFFGTFYKGNFITSPQPPPLHVHFLRKALLMATRKSTTCPLSKKFSPA